VFLTALFAASVLAGCSEDVADPQAGPTPAEQATTPSLCRELTPDASLEAAGWTAEGEAVVDGDTCRREGSGGAVSVQRRLVPAGSSDEVAAAADAAFEKRCDELGGMTDQPAAEDVDWLGDVPACAWIPDDPASYYALVVRWPDDRVIEARVIPAGPLTEQSAREALISLSNAADTAL
jgi:hypothetical protein